jgi:TonB family protein
MFDRTCALIAVAGLFRSFAATAMPLLQPNGAWVLDYADAQCIATRSYGDPKHAVVLGIRPAPNGETFELLVSRHVPSREVAEELEGDVDFGQGPIKAWILRYRIAAKGLDIYQFRIKASEMAQGQSAASVALHAEHGDDFAFVLNSIPSLIKGLEGCTADLKQYWNMDGEKEGRIVVSAKGDVRSVFTPDDYPVEAQRRDQQGFAQYLLLIDDKGNVAACHVVTPSGAPILDAMGCFVIQSRAKFTPARDRDGKPVRRTVITPRVSWRLES